MFFTLSLTSLIFGFFSFFFILGFLFSSIGSSSISIISPSFVLYFLFFGILFPSSSYSVILSDSIISSISSISSSSFIIFFFLGFLFPVFLSIISSDGSFSSSIICTFFPFDVFTILGFFSFL